MLQLRRSLILKRDAIRQVVEAATTAVLSIDVRVVATASIAQLDRASAF